MCPTLTCQALYQEVGKMRYKYTNQGPFSKGVELGGGSEQQDMMWQPKVLMELLLSSFINDPSHLPK